MTASLEYDLPPIEAAGVPRARQMLDRARWATRAFATYDCDSVLRIVEAVVRAAEENAEKYGEWAVRETGFGVVADKVVKNRLCSRGILEAYRDHDYVTPRVDAERKIVEVPRPAGVVLALTPSTNPVSTVYFKVILSLLTRNAVVVSPHPYAKECCSDATRVLAEAAVAAGAPDGVIQWVEEPSVPLIDALMTDPRTDVILATGGVAVVRAAYSSGNPAIGVGPGNVPVLVDATADLPRAARKLVDSKAFDNSVLCTNESVLVVEDAVADRLLREMAKHGAHLLDDGERDRVRDAVFPGGRFDTSMVGRDAATIAERAGVRVPPKTRVLLAPFDLAVKEEPLAHEKLCPVLGVTRVPTARRGIHQPARLVNVQRLGRPPRPPLRRIAEQRHIPLDVIPRLRPPDHRPQDTEQLAQGLRAQRAGLAGQPGVDFLRRQVDQSPPAETRDQVGPRKDLPVCPRVRIPTSQAMLEPRLHRLGHGVAALADRQPVLLIADERPQLVLRLSLASGADGADALLAVREVAERDATDPALPGLTPRQAAFT